MPEIRDRTYEDWPYQKITYECSPIEDQFSTTNVLTKEKYINYLDKQSRPKPDDLMANMTPLPKQTTSNFQMGYTDWCYILGQRDYACPYRSSGYYGGKRTYRRFQAVPPQTGFSLDFPNWSLPLRLKIKDEKINLGATLAEYRQSVSMFGSAAKGIANAWRTFKGVKRLKRRSMCSITSAHLIHDYGVAPLLSDVYSTVEALRLRLERPIYRRFHIKQGSPWVNTASGELDIGAGTASDSSAKYYTRQKYGQYVTANIKFDPTEISMFTFGNPADILWEITPFSFVVDWMIPIGDTLIALDALKAVDEMDVVVSRKTRVDTKIYPRGLHSWGAEVGNNTSGFYNQQTHERLYFDHIPLPPVPKPSLSGSLVRSLHA